MGREGQIMPLGTCKLCLEENKKLQESHFLPAALYSMAGKLIQTTPNVAVSSDMQLKTHLLCRDCEQRFNRNGESEVLRWLAPKANSKGIFPLLDKMKRTTPQQSGASLAVFSGPDMGVHTERFAYFMLSILWRAAVHQWLLPDSGTTSRINLESYEEPIRKYLLSEALFPADTIVVVAVCTDWVSRGAFFTPCDVPKNPYKTYALLTQGVYFRVLMESDLDSNMRQLCCSSSPNKWIFARSCEDDTVGALSSLLKTSKPLGDLGGLAQTEAF